MGADSRQIRWMYRYVYMNLTWKQAQHSAKCMTDRLTRVFISGDQCQNWLKNIIDYMITLMKLLKGKSGDAGESVAKKKPKWVFWDRTAFLRRYIHNAE